MARLGVLGLNKTEEQIREFVAKDVYNREFIIKFNLALIELQDDPIALATFCAAVMPVMKHMARQNKLTLKEFLDDLLKSDDEMVKQFGEHELMFIKKEYDIGG